MSSVRNKVSPLDWKTPIVDPETGAPTLQFIRLWQQLFGNEDGTNVVAEDASVVAGLAVPQSRLINTTTPIAGGGDLTADLTLTHANSGVAAAAYGDATHVAQITVDAKGHVTAAAAVAITANGSWTELLNHDFAVTPLSTKECDVTGYKELFITLNAVAYNTTAVQRVIQFSVDGGTNWFTTSGNYGDMAAAGTITNNTGIFLHNTATAAARTCSCHVIDNMAHSPITINCITRLISQVFVASATAVNRIRLMGSAVGSGTPSANNYTSGTFRVYGR